MRRSEYNEEIGREICEVIANTPKGIKQLCRENPHWPCMDTIFKWKRVHKSFAEQYTQAKRDQIEAYVEDIIDIADNATNDYCINGKGEEVLDNEHLHRSRLRIDTRKWLAGKLAPKIYGDKVQVENTNSNTDPEIQNARTVVTKLQADKHGRDNSTES